ncbi:MAG: tRNA (guanosine(46)-N7)-methyltransferase TrmB [Pirellulales bacterium]|nr:tRNA (guanosine(46)-N7)-methyltransferase TrmB [Pirellulales bacterium]
MGRRALRRIDPTLDLSNWLLRPESLPRPWQTGLLFGCEGPLEVELGSGKGLFLACAAARNPQRLYLGIEVAFKYAQFTAARLVRAGLPNAKVVHGEGQALFRDVLPEGGLAAVHVYFPDPWWKKRHHKRRVMNEAFVRDVHRTLVPGGRFHFWTDVEEYFLASLELIRQATGLWGPFPVPEHVPEHDLDYRTHFERRTRLQGGRVYRAEFVKAPQR